MREIKFRAIVPLSRLITYWSITEKTPEIVLAAINAGIQVMIHEYTGLKDKNGKEIYEGDILKLLYPRNYGFGIEKEEIHVKIEFQSGGFWFSGEGHTDGNWHFYNARDREVIGNIYETPELLTSKQSV